MKLLWALHLKQQQHLCLKNYIYICLVFWITASQYGVSEITASSQFFFPLQRKLFYNPPLHFWSFNHSDPGKIEWCLWLLKDEYLGVLSALLPFLKRASYKDKHVLLFLFFPWNGWPSGTATIGRLSLLNSGVHLAGQFVFQTRLHSPTILYD